MTQPVETPERATAPAAARPAPRARWTGPVAVLVALLGGFVLGTVGALGQDVVLRLPGVDVPFGLLLAAVAAGLAMVCAVASSRTPWPRFGLLAGWLGAVYVTSSSSPGGDLLLVTDARGTAFVLVSAALMSAVALGVPRWLR